MGKQFFGVRSAELSEKQQTCNRGLLKTTHDGLLLKRSSRSKWLSSCPILALVCQLWIKDRDAHRSAFVPRCCSRCNENPRLLTIMLWVKIDRTTSESIYSGQPLWKIGRPHTEGIHRRGRS